MQNDFLPVSQDDLKRKGWDTLDVIIITGDAYVDHPSYGAAVIGRTLEGAGFKTGIISQPDWKHINDFKKLGKPRLFFGITAGNMDSMVANYTAGKRARKNDDYSPGGIPGLRPDRATIVYANRIREAFGNIPIIIGGIEASLRRFAHYDWWDDSVRRSILLDARADILVYGMGERQVVEIARRLLHGEKLAGIRGTAIVSKISGVIGQGSGGNGQEDSGKEQALRGKRQEDRGKDQEARVGDREQIADDTFLPKGCIEIPSYEEVKNDKLKFNEAFKIIYTNQDPFRGKVLAQKYDTRYMIQYPPSLPLPEKELDKIYEFPYMRSPHPVYSKNGGIPGFETVKFSIISHRGCCGECAFCSLYMHQGRIIQSRSAGSILNEARMISEKPEFKGTITDIGGPTANLYHASCTLWKNRGACKDKYCLIPEKCSNLKLGYSESMELYSRILALGKVKHAFIESGIRYDLLIDKDSSDYFTYLCKHHISGQMKVAPEHSTDQVLKIMNKPTFDVYDKFVIKYNEINKSLNKKQYLVNYFISAHPGSTLEDTLSLALYLMKKNIHPEQIQDFTPLPLTLSGAIYYTEMHPFTNENIYVPKTFRERKMHRALIQYGNRKNRPIIREVLKTIHKEYLFKQFILNEKS
ncbi:MAG: YgiQ family radical SAM protein [Proteobacteria bacterium]|nr:YgiQ family radical SAM protein [Pseudomonadota bacterium]